jgi:outer membrane beta-barrel protein
MAARLRRVLALACWFLLCAVVTAPTQTPELEVTPTTIPTMRVLVEGTAVVVLRAGPAAEHAIVATALEGEELVIDARAGVWLHATTPSGASGWVHESLLGENIQRDTFAFQPDPGIPTRQRTLHAVMFVGTYAADREDNGLLFGGRMGYALTSRFAIEVGAGRTRIRRSTYVIEQIYNLRLEEEEFDVFFYEAGLNVDLLPGRRIAPFVAAGVGATILNARVEPTWSAAIGTRMFLARRAAVRWEVRDHRFESGNQFTRFQGDNIEFSGGLELLF